jgi:hypothetical protein
VDTCANGGGAGVVGGGGRDCVCSETKAMRSGRVLAAEA